MATLEVTISGLAGDLCVLQAAAMWSVHDVKAAVEVQLSIPIPQQRLFLLRGGERGTDGDELLSDEELLVERCKLSCETFTNVSLVLLRRSPETAEWLEKIRRNILNFKTAPDLIRADKEVALCAVQIQGDMLQFVASELSADKDIVWAAVQQCGMSLEFASEDLCADRDLVLLAATNCGFALKFVGEDLCSDYDIACAAVQANGMSLQYIQGEARTSREIALAAVRQFGQSLQFVGESFSRDRDIVLAALAQDGQALQYAAAELRAEREIVMASFLRGSGSNLRFASVELRADRDIVSSAMKSGVDVLKYASPELQEEFAPPPQTWAQAASDAAGGVALFTGFVGLALAAAVVGHGSQQEAPAQDVPQPQEDPPVDDGQPDSTDGVLDGQAKQQ